MFPGRMSMRAPARRSQDTASCAPAGAATGLYAGQAADCQSGAEATTGGVVSGVLVRRATFPAGSATQMSGPCAHAMRVPSGDQAGRCATPVAPLRVNVSCFVPDPSRVVTYSWPFTPTNAICVPSGDHAGPPFAPVPSTTSRVAPPSTTTAKTAPPAPYAISLPSGDQAG